MDSGRLNHLFFHSLLNLFLIFKIIVQFHFLLVDQEDNHNSQKLSGSVTVSSDWPKTPSSGLICNYDELSLRAISAAEKGKLIHLSLFYLWVFSIVFLHYLLNHTSRLWLLDSLFFCKPWHIYIWSFGLVEVEAVITEWLKRTGNMKDH